MISPAQSRLIDAQLAPAAIATQVSSAIAKKSLDAQKQQGAAVLQLLDAATNTQDIGASNNGIGGTLDVTA